MGTLSIIDWCKGNGNPDPTWEVRVQSEELVSAKQRQESRQESLEDGVVRLLQKGHLSKSEIANSLGHKKISSGLNKVIHSLLKRGKIAYTIPEKPNSRLQKYKLET